MEIENFINEFSEQFIDGDEIILKPETEFRTFESWDSLTGMSIVVMIKDVYGVDISDDEFKSCKTILEIFKLVVSKI